MCRRLEEKFLDQTISNEIMFSWDKCKGKRIRKSLQLLESVTREILPILDSWVVYSSKFMFSDSGKIARD